jgi:hypothetical protein
MSLLQNLVVYTGTGASKVTFSDKGGVIVDPKFGIEQNISSEKADEVAKEVSRFLSTPALWNSADMKAALDLYKLTTSNLPVDENGQWHVKAVIADEMNANLPGLRVGKRLSGEGDRVLKLVIYAIPNNNALRGYLYTHLRKMFSKDFQVQLAGKTTIDMNNASHSGKNASVVELMNTYSLKPEQVMYFGDELSISDDGIPGNDYSLTKIKGLKLVHTGIIPQLNRDPDVLYLAKGYQLGSSVLQAFFEDYRDLLQESALPPQQLP